MAVAAFEYSNLSGRPPGPVIRTLSKMLPGVREVQEQVVPYADRWQLANQAAMAGDGPLWVALGDSMTQGIGASDYNRGWIGQLAHLWLATSRRTSSGIASAVAAGEPAGTVPERLINLSSSGARVSDVLDRQLPAMAGLGVEPALVTVLIGSNDLIRPRSRRAFPPLFAAMLDQLPTGSVVASLPNPTRAAVAANELLENAVTTRGLVLAELRDRRTASWKGKLAADHFHPNDLGYAGIAAVFADAITGRRAA